MNILHFQATAPCLALVNIGQRTGNTVKFSRGNEVTFERHLNGFKLRTIKTDGSTNSFYWLGSDANDLSTEETILMVAAMIVMNMSAVVIGSNDLVNLDPSVVVHRVVVETPVQRPRPIKHLSDWKGAEAHGISGHRKEETSAHTRHSQAAPVELPKTKKGWLAFGAAALLTVGVIGLAAACSNE